MIGTVTFTPAGRFSFPRGYIKFVELHMDTVSNPSRSGDDFLCDWTDGVFHSHFTFRFTDEFREASTVGLTLDHVITEAFGTTDPPGGLFPLSVNLQIVADEDGAGCVLKMTSPGFGTTAKTSWLMDLMPSNYWQVSSEHA